MAGSSEGEALPSLSRRTVRAGFWAVSLNLTNRVLQFVRLVILARLLAPQDFGLLGIALLATATLETFSQTGFSAALIQKKENTDEYLDSAWIVSALRGILIFLILFFTAPFVAGFFENPGAKSVLQLIGVSLFFKGLTSIGVVYFLKQLEFRKQFIYQSSGTVVDFLVAVTLAFLLKNIWALVWGLLAGEVVRCAVSYVIHPYRPRFRFDPAKAKELFGFGRWILGSSIIVFLLVHGDDGFVAKVLGGSALGLYQMAYRFSNMPATEITRVVSQVAFPAYSKLQNRLEKLREAYLKVLQMTAFVSIPLAGGIFALAPEFVKIFMGEKWMPMVPAMRILCVFGVTRSINATLGSVFQGVGKPEVVTKGAGFQLAVLAAVIYPLTMKWGIVGTSLSVIIPNLLVLLYLVRRALQVLRFGFAEFGKLLLFPAVGAVFMILSISLFKVFIVRVDVVSFLVLMILGIAVNFGIVFLLDKVSDYGLGVNIRNVLKSLGITERTA